MVQVRHGTHLWPVMEHITAVARHETHLSWCMFNRKAESQFATQMKYREYFVIQDLKFFEPLYNDVYSEKVCENFVQHSEVI